VFTFTEVRLGISPATVAPYVISKIGISATRNLFLSGERFSAEQALRMGLVHKVVEPDDLDDAVAEKLDELLQAGPAAASATKKLIHDITSLFAEGTKERTAELIAELRASVEGQEGLSAFLEKRRPLWHD
jgi:methylglutaconyl-CoA hydratase